MQLNPEQQALVVANLHLADVAAKTMYPRFVDRCNPDESLDRLRSSAFFGLCKAAFHWRPDGGKTFETYALEGCTRQIKDDLMADSPIHVPRYLQDARIVRGKSTREHKNRHAMLAAVRCLRFGNDALSQLPDQRIEPAADRPALTDWEKRTVKLLLDRIEAGERVELADVPPCLRSRWEAELRRDSHRAERLAAQFRAADATDRERRRDRALATAERRAKDAQGRFRLAFHDLAPAGHTGTGGPSQQGREMRVDESASTGRTEDGAHGAPKSSPARIRM